LAVVVDNGPGVDNCEIFDPALSVHDRSCHYRYSQAHLYGRRNSRSRTDYVYDLKTIALKATAYGQAPFIVSDCYEGFHDPVAVEARQIGIGTHDRDTQYGCRFFVIDQADDPVYRTRVDQFDDHFRVVSGANDKHVFTIDHRRQTESLIPSSGACERQ
jgi:hypothetical protein